MTARRCLVSVLVLLLAATTPAAAARKARLVGKVVDADGKPVEGVRITITSPQLPDFQEVRTTDAKGAFLVDFRKVGVTYIYRFEKPGFQVTEAKQDWHLEGTQHSEWVLRKAVSAPTDEPLPTGTSAAAAMAYNTGLLALKANNYSLASEKFRLAANESPELRQAWEALAVVESELGRYREAAEAAERALALGSFAEPVLVARWQAYTQLKDEARAAIALEDLERIGRRREEAKRVHNEAVGLARAGDHERAMERFQTALNLDPNLKESQLGLATAALAAGRAAASASAAEAVLRQDPTNEKALRLRYNACLALNEPKRLVEALVGLAKLEPQLARNGLLKVAFDAYDQQQLEVAKLAFQQLLEIQPDHAQAYYYLGIIAIGEGASADARGYLQKFVQLAPGDPEAPSARAMLEQLGKS